MGLDVGDLVETTLCVVEVLVGDCVGAMEVGDCVGAMEVGASDVEDCVDSMEVEAGDEGDWDGATEPELVRRHKLLRESSSESRSALTSVFSQSWFVFASARKKQP